MKTTALALFVVLALTPSFAAKALAQLLDVGSSIGVDFGTEEGTTANWNAPALNGAITEVRALDGSVVSGIALSTSGATNQNNAPAVSGNLTGDFPLQAEGDWWFESGTNAFTFEFTGMDQGLVYSLTIGSFRSTTSATQIANGSTTWVVDGVSKTTVVNNASDAYVLFENLVADANGTIRITSLDNNGNAVGAVSVLRLDVTGGTPLGPTRAWGPTGPRAPAGQVSENPLLFSPTDPAIVDATAPAEMPNVLVIYADDLGFGDCSVNFPANSPRLLSTPNIDRLAAEGRNFIDSHSASAVCTPSRYSLLTGNYPFRQPDLFGNDPGLFGPAVPPDGIVFDPDTKTVGDVMKQAGYTTSWIGKWHLGFGQQQTRGVGSPKWNVPQTPGPNQCGLDYFYGLAAANSLPPYLYIENDTVVGLDPADPIVFNQLANTESQADWGGQDRGRKDTLDYYGGAAAAHAQYSDQSASEDMTAKAKEWLTAHEADPQDDPFFMILSTTAIHHPFTPNPRFEGTSLCGIYGDYVHELDWIVGEVMEHLQDLGVADETLIIITSDNGGMATNDPGTVALRDFEHQLNGNFLGAKFGVWEGGHRVPFIARWPGKIPAGSVSDEMFSQVDLMRTFANMVDVDLEEEDAVDSFDVMEILTRDPNASIRDSLFYAPRNSSRQAIRMGDWVYIPASGDGGFSTNIQRTRYLTDYYGIGYNHLSNGSIVAGNSTQLYNLATDPYQQQNVVNDATNSSIVAQLIGLRNDVLTGDRTAPTLLGDLNEDGITDCLDIDVYAGALGSVAVGIDERDLVVDRLIDSDDVAFLIENLVVTNNSRTGTFLGDLDCDGTVDVLGDAFVLIANIGNVVSSYSFGDINLDGTVDVLGDAFVLISNLGLTNE